MDVPSGAICEHCGEREAVYHCGNPYDEEIFPEDGPYPDEFWCEECYERQAEEI